MQKSIRAYLQQTGPYHVICREERNLCAVLYHLLLSNPENLPRFLKAIGRAPVKLENPEIYVEYAQLRDIWYAFGGSKPSPEEKNQTRREFILDALDLQSSGDLRNLSVEEFNRFFVAREPPSSDKIESPSNWSIMQLDKSFPKDSRESGRFIEAVRFKWCFNVKPDIVIFPSPNNAISIEAKLESTESKYPSGQAESKIFKERSIPKVPQTEIQKQAFDLLGIDAHHVILAKTGGRKDQFAWKEVLCELDAGQEPEFIKKQIESFKNRF